LLDGEDELAQGLGFDSVGWRIPMRVTLRDIAKQLGVSKAAVSEALHGGRHVSAQRRCEIQRLAKRMGYVPDPFLAGLAAHRRSRAPAMARGALAWINHWTRPEQLLKYREFQGYWRGAAEASTRYGYRLDDVRWEMDCSGKRLERILLARGIEGVLIPPHADLLDWGEFDWSRFSVVRFGMSVQNPDTNLVTADVFRAIVMAITAIHNYGYRRIGVTVNKAFNERLSGNFLSGFFYAQTLLKLRPALAPLETTLSTRDAADLEGQKRALERWLKREKPDAILTADIETPGMVRELGYRIPKDIGMAATSVADIPLDAGIDQRAEQIGRIAVETLVKQINIGERGEPADPCRILVESRWKDGSSLPPK
jgi:LacI family transcriptional regulator